MQQLSKETKHRIYVSAYKELYNAHEKGNPITICHAVTFAILELKKQNEIIYPFAPTEHIINSFLRFDEVNKHLDFYMDLDAWDLNREYLRFLILKRCIYDTAGTVNKIKYLLTSQFNTYAKFF